MVINIYSKTDTGSVREHNEDNFIIGPDPSINNWTNSGHNVLVGSKGVLIAIADGMGGAEAGEIASQIAIDTAKSVYTEKTDPFPIDNFEIIDILKEIILKAHLNINDNILQNPGRNGMGTTIIAGIIYKNNLFVGWCGDSRAYRFNKDGIPRLKHYDLEKLQILTQDHSMVWEYVESGKMTAEEARLNIHSNIITQSLGTKAGEIHPGISIFSLNEGDRLLFCSDGLNSMIADERISEILSIGEPAQQTSELLIDEAIHEGGHDNITLCIIDVLKTDEITLSTANDTVVTEMMGKDKYIDDEDKVGFRKKLLKSLLIAIPIVLAGFFATYYISAGFNKWINTKKEIIKPRAKKPDSVPSQTNTKSRKIDVPEKKPELPKVQTKGPAVTKEKHKDSVLIPPKTKDGKTIIKPDNQDDVKLKIKNMKVEVSTWESELINIDAGLKRLKNLPDSEVKSSNSLAKSIGEELKFIRSFYDKKTDEFKYNLDQLVPKYDRTKIEFTRIKAEFDKLKNLEKSKDIDKKSIDSVRQE